MWLALLNEQSPETVRALSGIEEISVDGTVTVDRVPTPGGRWPVAAVRDGLLFTTTDALELWDPNSQTFLESVPGPFAVATWDNRIAACSWVCTDLHLIDLDAGTDRIVNPPDGWFGFSSLDGAFSPDGRFTAVSVVDGPGPLRAETMFGIALIDFEAGTATTIPGSRFHGGPTDLSWNSDGQWLFVNTAEEILAYRPGDNTAYRIPVELEAGFYGRYFGMAAD